MRIKLSSVLVDNQDKALRFYTEKLGFVKKNDIPLGEARWLTVVSPDAPDETELLLEPNDNPDARAYQQAMHEQGIALTAFEVDDVASEHERLLSCGVKFVTAPTDIGATMIALFDDTCGNLIELYGATPTLRN